MSPHSLADDQSEDGTSEPAFERAPTAGDTCSRAGSGRASSGRATRKRRHASARFRPTAKAAVLGVPLLVVAISVLLLPERPANTARLDEAKLELAAALAEHDEAQARWHETGVTTASRRDTRQTSRTADFLEPHHEDPGRRATQAAEHAARLERATDRLHARAEGASQAELVLEQLRALVQPPATHPDPPLQWPVDGAVVSGYGLRAWPDFGPVHPGIDIVNVPGTSIRAAAGGLVVAARKDLVHGNAVVIEHGPQNAHPGTWRTVYAHLDEITVTEGEHVRGGDTIGTLGNSGQQTTGPHLHFEVRIEDQPVDPRRWLP